MPKVNIEDIQLHYEEQGEGHPLVFIHGLGFSTHDWNYQVDVFSQEYRVITLDLRGHGDSDKPPGPYSIEQLTDDTVALLDALNVETAHVVGLSLGGMIGFQLAVSHTSRVKTLTVVNSGPDFAPEGLRRRLSFFFDGFIPRVFGIQTWGEILAGRLFVKPEHKAMRHEFIKRFSENDKEAYLASRQAMINWSVRDQIGGLFLPTRVIASAQDFTSVSSKAAYVAKMPQAQLLVIPDSHHSLPVERPDEFFHALQEFLTLNT